MAECRRYDATVGKFSRLFLLGKPTLLTYKPDASLWLLVRLCVFLYKGILPYSSLLASIKRAAIQLLPPDLPIKQVPVVQAKCFNNTELWDSKYG